MPNKIKIRKNEPIYLDICKNWYQKSLELKDLINSKEKSNIQIFARFFFLWCSFNALYNLAGSYRTSDFERIKACISKLKEEDIEKILKKNKAHCDYFINRRDLIVDMKRNLHGLNSNDYINVHQMKKFYWQNINKKDLLISLIKIIYKIRNNLTHGSKEIRGDNITIINNAIPIVDYLTMTIANKVFNVDLL